MSKDLKEYKEYKRAYYQAHKKEIKARSKDYYQAHKEECKARSKAYRESYKKENKDGMKSYYQAHKEERKEYSKADVNSLGLPKNIIRSKSRRYLNKYGTKIPGYEIHHCCTYTEPYKFIYCSKEMHQLIHNYLRDNNIDADSDHYAQIKHLLDDTVVLYGL